MGTSPFTRDLHVVFESEVFLIGSVRDKSITVMLLVFSVQVSTLSRSTTLAGVLRVDTPVGPICVDLDHAGPAGGLVVAEPSHAEAFRPPSIFSAPLPSGSGARALGLAGAFTAVADDATAASWNPAGLTQLERPEVSGVLRFSFERDRHQSRDTSFRVGEDDFNNVTLNYLSLVYPFYSPPIKRNVVVSLNLQEAYDFTQSFSARPSGTPVTRRSSSKVDTFSDVNEGTFVETIGDPGDPDVFVVTLDFKHDRTTRTSTSTLEELFGAGILSSLEFEQEGVISALSPALAVELTPKLSFGLALNYYHIDPTSGDAIRSETFAAFSGISSSLVNSVTTQTTTGEVSSEGTVQIPSSGGAPPIEVPIPPSSQTVTFEDTTRTQSEDAARVEGTFHEISEFTDLYGFNANLGLLWTVSRFLSLGASVDLPWTAKADQKRIIRNRITTLDPNGSATRNTIDTIEEIKTDVELEFPLFWSVGMVYRWTPECYTTLDVSQTLWSDFSFKAKGQPEINPLDGTLHSERPLDDTWAVRTGIEYLLIWPTWEMPLRGGLAWEQRPAIGEPDDYFSLSLGAGFSRVTKKGEGKNIYDIACILTHGNDVKSIVPEQAGLASEITEFQVFVSCIRHF